MILRSEWTKLKYTLNLVRCFIYIQLSFSIFFMDSKANCQIHVITDMFKNIWKEYFIKECFWSERNILRVRFYCLAVPDVRSSHAARLNVIYTKCSTRCAMIAHLNKIWCVWACARAIARHSWPGLYYKHLFGIYRRKKSIHQYRPWRGKGDIPCQVRKPWCSIVSPKETDFNPFSINVSLLYPLFSGGIEGEHRLKMG